MTEKLKGFSKGELSYTSKVFLKNYEIYPNALYEQSILSVYIIIEPTTIVPHHECQKFKHSCL